MGPKAYAYRVGLVTLNQGYKGGSRGISTQDSRWEKSKIGLVEYGGGKIRTLLRAFRRNHDWKVADWTEYRRIRNSHLYEIRRAKGKSWKEFASSINKNVWGPT